MKKSTFLILLILIASTVKSQSHYSKTINFESNRQLVEIDTLQQTNIWQIGQPQKSFLDSAYSIPYAIITDTINSYPINNLSSFQVKIYSPPQSCWGIGSLNFMHKYDFELNKDGGYIEVKYDNDTNWTNIIFDMEAELGIYLNEFYTETDTILGGIPAFTGSSATWKYSEIMWIWFMGVRPFIHDSLTIRFTMKSDAIETNNEGWLIDNIQLLLEDCTGSIQYLNATKNSSFVYPNPMLNNSVLKFENPSKQKAKIDIFDISGKPVRSIETTNDKVDIRSQDLSKGIYTYQIHRDNLLIGTGKFIVE
jgi:Secretion system C-terminal sorting domain